MASGTNTFLIKEAISWFDYPLTLCRYVLISKSVLFLQSDNSLLLPITDCRLRSSGFTSSEFESNVDDMWDNFWFPVSVEPILHFSENAGIYIYTCKIRFPRWRKE